MPSKKGCGLKHVNAFTAFFYAFMLLNAYINIKMVSYDLESNTKVVQDEILNKIKSTYFQLGRGMTPFFYSHKIL